MTVSQSVKKRAEAKIGIDSLLLEKYNLNTGQEAQLQRVTVLTEGAVLDSASASGVRFYLAKGTLEKSLQTMEDRVYYLNVGHDTVSPISIVGSFTKNDLSIEKAEDGRSWLKANFTLDEEHIYIKELRRQNKPLSFSAEFYPIKESILELTKEELASLGYESEHSYFIRAINEIEIDGFAVVVEPADTNAYQVTNLNLQNMGKTKLQNNQEEETKVIPADGEVIAEVGFNPGDDIGEAIEKLEEQLKDGEKKESEEEVTEEVVEEEVKPEDVDTQLLSVKTKLETMSTEIETLKKENLEWKNNYEKLKASKDSELSKVQKTLSELLQKAEPIARDEATVDFAVEKALQRTAI